MIPPAGVAMLRAMLLTGLLLLAFSSLIYPALHGVVWFAGCGLVCGLLAYWDRRNRA